MVPGADGAGQPAITSPCACGCGAPLDREALDARRDRSWRVTRRCAHLREVDGEPVQRIAPEESGFCCWSTTCGRRAGARRRDRLMAEEARAALRPGAGPLFRGRLTAHGRDDHVLLVTMHHIVSDGWSMGVLTRELGALYGAFRGGGADPLPALPVQYADYACGSAAGWRARCCRRQAEYWKTRWRARRRCWSCRPTTRARRSRTIAARRAWSWTAAGLTAALKALAAAARATLFMTLLAGWAALLAALRAGGRGGSARPGGQAHRGRGRRG